MRIRPAPACSIVRAAALLLTILRLAYSSLTQWSTQDEELNARNAEFGKASDEVKYLLKSYEEMQGQLTASKKKNTEQSRVR